MRLANKFSYAVQTRLNQRFHQRSCHTCTSWVEHCTLLLIFCTVYAPNGHFQNITVLIRQLIVRIGKATVRFSTQAVHLFSVTVQFGKQYVYFCKLAVHSIRYRTFNPLPYINITNRSGTVHRQHSCTWLWTTPKRHTVTVVTIYSIHITVRSVPVDKLYQYTIDVFLVSTARSDQLGVQVQQCTV